MTLNKLWIVAATCLAAGLALGLAVTNPERAAHAASGDAVTPASTAPFDVVFPIEDEHDEEFVALAMLGPACPDAVPVCIKGQDDKLEVVVKHIDSKVYITQNPDEVLIVLPIFPPGDPVPADVQFMPDICHGVHRAMEPLIESLHVEPTTTEVTVPASGVNVIPSPGIVTNVYIENGLAGPVSASDYTLIEVTDLGTFRTVGNNATNLAYPKGSRVVGAMALQNSGNVDARVKIVSFSHPFVVHPCTGYVPPCGTCDPDPSSLPSPRR